MQGFKEQLLSRRDDSGGHLRGVSLIALERNQGKGQALRRGVLAAAGDWILTLDADMACPPAQLCQWQEQGFINLEAAPQGHQAYFGDREHPLSEVDDLPHRRFMGKVFNTIVQVIADLPFEDTQCGFKLYSRPIARQCFGLVKNWGWAHDVEISKVLLELGCPIQTLPIGWTAIAGSKIKPLSDACKMLVELAKIETSFIMRFKLGLGQPAMPVAAGVTCQRLSLALGLALLLLVLGTFRDYVFAWDEAIQAKYGELVVRYYWSIFSDGSMLELKNLYLLGGFLEAAIHLLGKLLPLEYYQARHLITALFGLLGMAGAWRLAGYLSGPRAGLWSAMLLATTPMYYGHIFNNSQDVTFAVAYVWFAYYLVRACGHLPRVPRGLALKLGVALVVCLGTVVFLAAAGSSPSQAQLFDGLYHCSLSMPPNYITSYLLYTLPEVLIIGLLGLGCWSVWRRLSKRGRGRGFGVEYACLVGAVAIPLALIIINRWALRDGLSHLLFIIPPLAVLAGLGLDKILAWVEAGHRKAALVLSGVLVLAVAGQAGMMARLHPYEYLYYNSLLGGLKGAQGKYELDYRGLSHAEALTRLGAIIAAEEKASGGPEKTYYVFSGGGGGEVLNHLGSAIASSLRRTDCPLTADFHVDTTRWDYHLTTNGITMAVVERLGVPLNYIKDLRPVAPRVLAGRKISCEAGFRPTPRLPLENPLGQGACQGVTPSLEKAWEVLGK
jgi:hypothetical protein